MTDQVERAAAAVERERTARAAAARALIERDQEVRGLFLARPDMGPTEIARATGLTPSTVRAITRDLAADRRAGPPE